MGQHSARGSFKVRTKAAPLPRPSRPHRGWAARASLAAWQGGTERSPSRAGGGGSNCAMMAMIMTDDATKSTSSGPGILKLVLLCLAVLVGLVGLLGVGGLIFLYFAVANPWGRMSDSQKEAYLHELVDHYEPLVSAIHAYEDDHGWPPPDLDALVPDYLYQLPTLEPKHVHCFSYDVSCNWHDVQTGPGNRRFAWYLGQGLATDEHFDWQGLGVKGLDHTHLVFGIGENDQVRTIAFHPASPTVEQIPYDPDQWRQQPTTRESMFEGLRLNQGLNGSSWSEVESKLGPPDRMRSLSASWSIDMWFPEAMFDLDSDNTFAYNSGWREKGVNQEFRGWSYSE